MPNDVTPLLVFRRNSAGTLLCSFLFDIKFYSLCSPQRCTRNEGEGMAAGWSSNAENLLLPRRPQRSRFLNQSIFTTIVGCCEAFRSGSDLLCGGAPVRVPKSLCIAHDTLLLSTVDPMSQPIQLLQRTARLCSPQESVPSQQQFNDNTTTTTTTTSTTTNDDDDDDNERRTTTTTTNKRRRLGGQRHHRRVE